MLQCSAPIQAKPGQFQPGLPLCKKNPILILQHRRAIKWSFITFFHLNQSIWNNFRGHIPTSPKRMNQQEGFHARLTRSWAGHPVQQHFPQSILRNLLPNAPTPHSSLFLWDSQGQLWGHKGLPSQPDYGISLKAAGCLLDNSATIPSTTHFSNPVHIRLGGKA